MGFVNRYGRRSLVRAHETKRNLQWSVVWPVFKNDFSDVPISKPTQMNSHLTLAEEKGGKSRIYKEHHGLGATKRLKEEAF